MKRFVQVLLTVSGAFLLVFAGWAGALHLPLVWLLGLPFLLLGIFLSTMLRPQARERKTKLWEFLENTPMTQIQPRS
jgi:hypothetical protein